MPAVSILTPTWNRAHCLERLWSGLAAQSCKDFEWIVADDGSTDGTADLVRELAGRSDFPVLFLKAEAHVGKVRLDNESIALARGDFILWCGSDDMLLPHAVERLLGTWQSIPPAERTGFMAAGALSATEQGVICDPAGEGESEGSGYADYRWNELFGGISGDNDMTVMFRTPLLKAHPFPEVDLVVPESVVLCELGERKFRMARDVVQLIAYGADGISRSPVMSYNRGRAYSLASTERAARQARRGRISGVWALITFQRYAQHGELRVAEARALWGGNSPSWRFWAARPLALLLAARDRLRNKVVPTHREFLANRGSRVEAEWLRSEADLAR